MVSDWIIISAMLVLGAVVVLFIRTGQGDDLSNSSRAAGRNSKATSGK